MSVDYETWSHGTREQAMAVAYMWLMENAQPQLARMARRFPLEGASVEDRIQRAAIAVCRSSAKRAGDGSIPNADHLERYLTVGALRQVRYHFLQETYRSKPLPLVERVQGSASSPSLLIQLARLRRQLAADFHDGVDGWSAPAASQARYEAAEALLEAEGTQALSETWTSPFVPANAEQADEGCVEGDGAAMEAINSLMDDIQQTFELTPDAPEVMELLQQRTCAPYLMWRLGLDYSKSNRNTYYQLRKVVGAKLAEHPEVARLEHLVERVGRNGHVILARAGAGRASS